VNLTAVSGLISWLGICVTYIRFHAGLRAQEIDRTKLPFSSRLQPFAAWYGAIGCFFICFVSETVWKLTKKANG
jgi:yeast amino acid transporter